MSEKLFYPQEKLSNEAHIKSMDYYYKEYKRSIEDQNKFWEEKAFHFTEELNLIFILMILL